MMQTDRPIASFLQDKLPCLQSIPFAIRLPDGMSWKSSDEDPRFTVVIHHPGALGTLCLAPDQLSLGEAFIFGDLDIEGDIFSSFHLLDALNGRQSRSHFLQRLGTALRLFAYRKGRWFRESRRAGLRGALHSRKRDEKAIRFHYDLGNDFYKLWLDERMVYSCGYFRSPSDDLDVAQVNKLDYLCRKLRLKPGERLLDIGCGWGGLIVHAAREYGVDAVGITLSRAQADVAGTRIREAGLGGRCSVLIRDYRDMDGEAEFDKVVSVGMFEHVGRRMLPEYFGRAWRLLKPGGAFLNHGIASSFGNSTNDEPSFIDNYVFPDGELLPVSEVLHSAEASGFEIRDLESLREHYALTLRHWVRRLENAKKLACRVTDDVTYRIWRIYMAGSAHGFETAKLNLYQALLVKPDRGQANMPLTRNDWYKVRQESCRPAAVSDGSSMVVKENLACT